MTGPVWQLMQCVLVVNSTGTCLSPTPPGSTNSRHLCQCLGPLLRVGVMILKGSGCTI